MNVKKEIDWDGYNEATVKKIDKDGSILCDLRHIELKDEEEIVSKSDINISFPSDNCPFELTQDEIDIINDVKI